MRVCGTITAVAALALSGCLDPCGNEIVEQQSSPDRKKRAVVFQRDCGATTAFSTQVSVLKLDQPLPHEAGNVFIADDNRGPLLPVGVRWESPSRLVVTYPLRARVFLQREEMNGVKVAYEKTP